MTHLARTERSALCDLALELGADAPTLSGAWTVRDLVAHLLVREGSPAAVGVVVPPLAKLTEAARRRLACEDLPVLVGRLRNGPPVWSPFRPAFLDRVLNTLEYYVHHEDIRRAQHVWEPRVLERRAEKVLWQSVRVTGRALVRSAPVGVVVERTDTGERAVLRNKPGAVTVRGLPSEVVLFVYGRQAQARVDLDGVDSDVALLTGADLGI